MPRSTKTVADFPEIAAQWHPTKNGDCNPTDIFFGTTKKAWWKCPHGPDHEWESKVHLRTKQGYGCPFCRGLRVSKTNCLANLFPDVSKEWDPTKNGELSPNLIVASTRKKYWWKCSKGPDHEWLAAVHERTGTRDRQGTGCPFCSGKRVSITNSLSSLFPEVAEQWHPTRNKAVEAGHVVAGSGCKYWWKCPEGPDHEWEANVSSRTGPGKRGCPFCNGKKSSVTNSLAMLHPMIASQWHPKNNGKVKPEDVVAGSNRKYWWKCLEGPDHEWLAAVHERTGTRDRQGTGCPFCSGKRVSITNSLSSLFPEVAEQWHPTRNKAVEAGHVVAGSGCKYWWKCPEGPDHEWEANVSSRTGPGKRGCPFCNGKTASTTNSLAALFPRIASEWHPTKNSTVKPTEVVAGSAVKYWWKCPEGPDHEWEAAPHSRIKNPDLGCPFCDGKRVSVTTSLANVAPQLLNTWHPTRNKELTPHCVVSGSLKKVWWKCNKGPDHEWLATPSSRTRPNGSNCPFCAGKRVSVTNSLATIFPHLADTWHPTRNKDLTPHDVVAHSSKRVWWKCSEGPDHEWATAVSNRTAKNATGCPCCQGQKLSVTNSLATVFPDLAAQWHPKKNENLIPELVLSGSHTKVWWKCPHGPDHEWESSPNNRTQQGGRNCPFCANMRVSTTNNIAAVAPQLIDEWHPAKNGSTTPDLVVAASERRYWWKCPKGPDHEWRATAYSRTGLPKSGCPFCAGHKPSVTNSLATLHPTIALQWHPQKNGKVKPKDVVAGSNRKYWWKCPNGTDHTWQATVGNRTGRRSDCPFCTIVPRSKVEVYLCHELITFFDFDVSQHRLRLDGKIRDIDILIPDLNLAIEFDGSYWHRDKQDSDKAKTILLEEAGWKVIRVREKPLRKISKVDIQVPIADAPQKVKVILDQLLPQIEKVCNITIPKLAAYLKRKTLKNKKAADAYIEKLRAEKAAEE